jgi:hypothetical protein
MEVIKSSAYFPIPTVCIRLAIFCRFSGNGMRTLSLPR